MRPLPFRPDDNDSLAPQESTPRSAGHSPFPPVFMDVAVDQPDDRSTVVMDLKGDASFFELVRAQAEPARQRFRTCARKPLS